MSKRPRHLSAAVMLALLSPAVTQPVDCETQDNAGLSVLRLEVAGQDQVVGFQWSKHTYAVTLPAGLVTLEVRSIEPSAQIRYTYLFDDTTVEEELGVGAGTAALAVPMGSSNLIVTVTAGVTEADYVLAITGAESICGDRVAVPPEECDDGNDIDNDGCSSACTLESEIEPVARVVPVACENHWPGIDFVETRPYELTVKPQTPIVRGRPFEVEVSGKIVIPELWLDWYQQLDEGTTALELATLQATVEARGGASGAPVTLVRPQPYADGRCDYPLFGPCARDGDCGDDGQCHELVEIPVLDGTGDNCSACLAKGYDKFLDCERNGFCVAGPLELALEPVAASFVAGNGGEVLLGWNEDPAPPKPWLFLDSGPNGIRWTLNTITPGLLMGFECPMGTADAEETGSVPLPDSALLSLPIAAVPE